jgi:trigger factor
MGRHSKLLSLILAAVLTIPIFAGCSTEETTETIDFSYSDGIDDNGLWENITALDYVELCEYESIPIPGDIHEITDESIQAEIDTILADYAYDEHVTDRAVVDGDTVNIDYVGSIDGIEFEGGSTEGAGTDVTIGVTGYIDDFLEQLIGHAPGESFDIEVTFPEDYGEESLNGKDAVFAITINYIIENVKPNLTDEFVMDNLSSDYGWSTVAEMEADIKSDLQSTAVESYVHDYIIENTNVISLPETLLGYQEKSLICYTQECAEYHGMDIEGFLNNIGISSTDELLQLNETYMTETATYYLIMQAIAEDTSISVSEEDVADYFNEYVGVDDYSEYEDYYGMPYIKLSVLIQKVMDYIVDSAVLE